MAADKADVLVHGLLKLGLPGVHRGRQPGGRGRIGPPAPMLPSRPPPHSCTPKDHPPSNPRPPAAVITIIIIIIMTATTTRTTIRYAFPGEGEHSLQQQNTSMTCLEIVGPASHVRKQRLNSQLARSSSVTEVSSGGRGPVPRFEPGLRRLLVTLEPHPGVPHHTYLPLILHYITKALLNMIQSRASILV